MALPHRLKVGNIILFFVASTRFISREREALDTVWQTKLFEHDSLTFIGAENTVPKVGVDK